MLIGNYYDETEFTCPCCGACPGVSPKLISLLDDVTGHVGHKLEINSAYRCDLHNAEVGGVSGSQHNANPLTAVDIDASGIGVDQLAQIAADFGADGVGRYYDQDFVHMDVRSGRINDLYRWNDQ